jgi:hypothetical protein
MADPFAGLQVLYQNRPIYCLAVKGALSPGNWVLFKNNDPTFETEEETSVGLILATSEDGSLMEVDLLSESPQSSPEISFYKLLANRATNSFRRSYERQGASGSIR